MLMCPKTHIHEYKSSCQKKNLFWRGWATLQAVQCLQNNIGKILSLPREKMHAIFIDFNKDFGTINRNIVVENLKTMVGHQNFLYKIKEYSQWWHNEGKINKAKHWSLAGRPLSPLLYHLGHSSRHKISIIRWHKNFIYLYADDMVRLSSQKDFKSSYN